MKMQVQIFGKIILLSKWHRQIFNVSKGFPGTVLSVESFSLGIAKRVANSLF